MKSLSCRHGQILTVMAALIAGALAVSGCGATGANASGTQRTATLAKGTIAVDFNASGKVLARSEVQLGFGTSGTVAEVRVKLGDRVRKGDILARLDTTDAEIALAQAQQAVIGAQTAYSRTVDGPAAADVASAQAALNAANANYVKVKAGPEKADYADAQAAFENADAALRQAQGAYDIALARNPGGITASPQAMALWQATNNYNAAKAKLDKLSQGPDNAELSQAYQQIQSAKAALDKLQQPAKPYDVEKAQADVKTAELNVQQAQRRIDEATLTAPVDGYATAVNIEVGENAGTQPVITLVDTSELHTDITVDEVDIAKVKPGQAVRVTLDALPGIELTGTVQLVVPEATTLNGVVSYNVRVTLPQTSESLLPGMTTNAYLSVGRRENVLLAPNWAVRRDKQSGRSFLTTQVDSKTTKEIEVKTGLKTDSQTEIVSGAGEGQVVVQP